MGINVVIGEFFFFDFLVFVGESFEKKGLGRWYR